MSMIRLKTRFLPLLFSVLVSSLLAQKPTIPLINSGEVIKEGKVLYDSGRYKAAIEKYLTVPKRDTNYVYMLTELALTYAADSSYEKAVKICDEALQFPSTHRAHLMRTKAISLDKKGDYDASIKAFKDAIDRYPFNYSLYFNLGITYYNHGEHDLAAESFFNSLNLNPFHALSHLNLANLAIGAKRRTHAMLAMGAYLSINNEDNKRLVNLNAFLGNEMEEEITANLSLKNGCEKLDQMIKAGIAMDKKFDSKMPLSAAVVRQYELFFKQLNGISASPDNRWLNYYLGYYKTLISKQLDQAFLYHILTSSSNEDVKKWLKKNDKTLSAFYAVANEELKRQRAMVNAPKRFGYSGPVQAWYGTNNQFDGLGANTNGENRQGQWYYFNDNHEMVAEGKFSNNKKVGVWKYYYDNGNLKSIQNNETGAIQFYYESGGLDDKYTLKEGKIQGVVESYYGCGAPSERTNYLDGNRSGPGEIYFVSGQKSAIYNYKDDLLDGEYLAYHQNGTLLSKEKFVAGKTTGLYEEYYSNGQLYSTGNHVDGKQDGLWKYYYRNGQLMRSGSAKEGSGIGEWLYYDYHGVLTEKRLFNEKGEWHGESTLYYKGKPYVVTTYKNDLLIKLSYFDVNGKLLGAFGDNSGNFSSKSFFANGQLASTGVYKKGVMDGLWVYYFPEGMKRKEVYYKAGKTHGSFKEYFRTGGLKNNDEYVDDQPHGYSQEFYLNGQLKQEGWFQKGEREQQWKSYYSDGTLESDNYYFKGQLHGEQFNYGQTGTLTSVYTDEYGAITNIADYNADGKLMTTIVGEGPKKVYETRYNDGKLKVQYNITCGRYAGPLVHFFPNGKECYAMDWANGYRQGTYRNMSIDNTMDWGGNWVDGNKTGWWEERNSVNQLEARGKMVNNEYDSIWTYYYITGAVSSRAEYQNDDREGVTDFFTPEGTHILSKLYEGGMLSAYKILINGQWSAWQLFKPDAIIKATLANGLVVYDETYQNGLQHGKKRIYYESGKLYSEYDFKQGDYEGSYSIFHANGKLAETGIYKNDELMSIKKYFAEDGTLVKEEEFLLGVPHGRFTSYKGGKLVNEVKFFAGEPAY